MTAHRQPTDQQHERGLLAALGLTCGFLLAEVLGGFLSASLALLSDAAYMTSSSAALAIAFFAVRLARLPANPQRSFRYHRFAILATAFNVTLLAAVAACILYEAYRRLAGSPQIDTGGMLGIAVLGLLINIASLQCLRAGKDRNPHLKVAHLAIWSDLLGSAGVIAGAIAIRLTGWMWVDSLLAIGMALWLLPHVWLMLKTRVDLLLEGVPEEIDVANLRECLLAIPGIRGIHDLHVWSIASGKVSLTVHVVHSPEQPSTLVQSTIRRMLAVQFGITRVTVQCELSRCEQTDEVHQFSRRRADGKPHQRHAGHGH